MRWVNVLNACFNGIWYALSGIMDVLRNGEIYLLIFWRVIISLWIIEMSTYHPLPVPVVMQYHTIPFIDSAIHRWCGYLPPPPQASIIRSWERSAIWSAVQVMLYFCICVLAHYFVFVFARTNVHLSQSSPRHVSCHLICSWILQSCTSDRGIVNTTSYHF